MLKVIQVGMGFLGTGMAQVTTKGDSNGVLSAKGQLAWEGGDE